MAQEGINRGWTVTSAGTGINLALGVLYTWSIFKGAIKQSVEKGGPGDFNWDMASLNDPYAVCCLVFSVIMILAGRIQDRFGPQRTAMIGGLLVGLGFILASTTTDYLSWVIGFGVLAGSGIAFGYSSATPAALKWFPPDKTGRITGIVVAGFGLASVYIAPLSQYLLNNFGIGRAMLFYGIAFPIVVCSLAVFLVNPPSGFVPEGFAERRRTREAGIVASSAFEDTNTTPLQMLRSPMFWVLWLLYFIGAGAGLMVIGSLAGMAKASMGSKAFLAVAILAIGNAGGRIAAGMLSDKIGRKRTLASIFAFQALLMVASIYSIGGHSNALYIVLLATLIGFNYGANLSIFPSYAKDLWGMKNFGVNYGIIFTAWGVGGLVMSRVSQYLSAAGGGSYRSSFMLAGALLTFGAVIALVMRDRKEEARQEFRRHMAAPLKQGI
jgi:MFS family permease